MRTQSETEERFLIQAKRDRDDYWLAMLKADSKTCLKIEQHYSLDGYPPELVTIGLNAAAKYGVDPEMAIETYMVDNRVELD